MSVPRDDGFVYLADYTAPAWRIPQVELQFELAAEATEVVSRLQLVPDPAQGGEALVLDGVDLELLAIAVDGVALAADRYRYDGRQLQVPGLDRACVLETRVRIRPAANTRLEGLYRSGRLLLTQCEAEGFRRISFMADRPDVMPRWRIVLRAARTDYPVLLANGNPLGTADLGGGQHEATWENPHPTPAYLFAIAAGPLERVTQTLDTAEGRRVELNIWAEAADVARCAYALGAVERALRWDERRFGRGYDLDVFNVVAAQDFTMGAMENKGLNIFNARYILADEATATDADFLAIESVVAHEYLHNWSGNRVTLRDWFQLSLKEGLTVFRDTEFSSDLHSRALKRIEVVRLLRGRQFAEDAGALAHAVRPDRYREISNFYTLTIYEKGAEIVRVLHTLVGDTAFRAGMDRYFADNDGRAATLEEFLAAHQAASGRDLSQFARWYSQAGTPELRIREHYDAASGDYTLTVDQHTPPTPGQAQKQPLLIPLRFALYGADGAPVTTPPDTGAAQAPGLVELTRARHVLRWTGLTDRPLPAFNQAFAAPVKLDLDYAADDLARLARLERDPFNRWDLLQRLATGALLGTLDAESATSALSDALADLLDDDAADPAFVAECLALPDFDTLAEAVDVVEVESLVARRESLVERLAEDHVERLERRYHALAATARQGLSGAAMSARALRNACLAWLTRLDPQAALAQAQFAAGGMMTERLAALRCLLHFDAPDAAAALQSFRDAFAHDPLVTDKWIGLVATRPHPDSRDAVLALLASPWWKATNPNRVRALLGSFARGNALGFHRRDGGGYRLLAEQILGLDALNPQVAARLLGSFESWRRLAQPQRGAARAALESLQGGLVSPDSRDLLQRLLED
ncbi:aminopeptidase N [Arenimonas terrae]|uniref:Aminopeptidase N n=1 Tax=Arenimonas terrae TaxID=2546226 RepID=A0A5C4RN86_9GAMM|nr:aminopeptidase N [Arenimonas terrae]TNJ32713.1 aminopeptidase N [Arenimonas terrae]